MKIKSISVAMHFLNGGLVWLEKEKMATAVKAFRRAIMLQQSINNDGTLDQNRWLNHVNVILKRFLPHHVTAFLAVQLTLDDEPMIEKKIFEEIVDPEAHGNGTCDLALNTARHLRVLILDVVQSEGILKSGQTVLTEYWGKRVAAATGAYPEHAVNQYTHAELNLAELDRSDCTTYVKQHYGVLMSNLRNVIWNGESVNESGVLTLESAGVRCVVKNKQASIYLPHSKAVLHVEGVAVKAVVV